METELIPLIIEFVLKRGAFEVLKQSVIAIWNLRAKKTSESSKVPKCAVDAASEENIQMPSRKVHGTRGRLAREPRKQGSLDGMGRVGARVRAKTPLLLVEGGGSFRPRLPASGAAASTHSMRTRNHRI